MGYGGVWSVKREAYRHPKMHDLASRLGIPLCHAAGLVQFMLDFTADNACQGNIGKWPNGAIARGSEWQGNADALISALVESGWLDICPVHRLVVHDLSDHAEQWWKNKLAKMGKTFIAAKAPVLGSDLGSVPTPVPGSDLGSGGLHSSLLFSSLPTPSLNKALADIPLASCPTTSNTNVAGQKPRSEVPENTNGRKKREPAETIGEPWDCIGPSTWRLPKSVYECWKKAYVGLDIDYQLGKARAWLLSNQLKTPAGMPRFLNQWLAREHDRDSKRASGGNNEVAQLPTLPGEP